MRIWGPEWGVGASSLSKPAVSQAWETEVPEERARSQVGGWRGCHRGQGAPRTRSFPGMGGMVGLGPKHVLCGGRWSVTVYIIKSTPPVQPGLLHAVGNRVVVAEVLLVLPAFAV